MRLKNSKGITLIALVITIIILIILVGVAIALSLGENGIINKAKYAKQEHLNAQASEGEDINDMYSKMLIATNDSSQITISVEDLNKLIEEKVEEKLEESRQKGEAYIVEKNINGNNWYRIWSDGWIEQGGLSSAAGSQAGATTTLLKPYSNANYTLIVSPGPKSRSNASARTAIVTSQSASSFVASSSWVSDSSMAYQTNTIYWYACGY